MERYAHGGEVDRVARELGVAPEAIIDFSASISPFGMPQGVNRAVLEALPVVERYPEVDAATLRDRLAEFHRLPAEMLLPGSGATELIYLLPRVLKPGRALVVTPAFSEYERGLRQAGAAVDFFPLDPEEGFRFDAAELVHAVSAETRMVILANPSNPTGALIPPQELERMATALREHAVVVVDEAFVDFCPDHSLLDTVVHHNNLYVLRSLTKFYAIPGLRAGYLAGPARGIARIAMESPPWSLSTLAQSAAIACLKEEAYRRRVLAELPALREGLSDGLKALGLTVFSSRANYLLVRMPRGRAADLAAVLRRRGILIRDCANFHPLDVRYFRVAVRSAPDNDRLLAELQDVVPQLCGA